MPISYLVAGLCAGCSPVYIPVQYKGAGKNFDCLECPLLYRQGMYGPHEGFGMFKVFVKYIKVYFFQFLFGNIGVVALLSLC